MKRFLKEWGLFSLFISCLILSRIFLLSPVTVDGHSMDPTLYDNEQLLMLRVGGIKRFDIVVASETGDDGKEKLIVKRLIGLPGDTIHYENDTLYINGEKVDEDYLDEYKAAFAKDKLQSTYTYNEYFQERAQAAQAFTLDNQGNSSFTIQVPEGQYYLLGDDRIVSLDSRSVGSFERSSIKGKIIFRLWPLKRIKVF